MLAGINSRKSEFSTNELEVWVNPKCILESKCYLFFFIFNIHIISNILEIWGGFKAGSFCGWQDGPLSVCLFSLSKVNQLIDWTVTDTTVLSQEL